MRFGNCDAIDEEKYSKIDWELSYRPSLEVALDLSLGSLAKVKALSLKRRC